MADQFNSKDEYTEIYFWPGVCLNEMGTEPTTELSQRDAEAFSAFFKERFGIRAKLIEQYFLLKDNEGNITESDELTEDALPCNVFFIHNDDLLLSLRLALYLKIIPIKIAEVFDLDDLIPQRIKELSKWASN